MSADTTLGEDERPTGFPIYLTDRALALVKAEGLRQAADLLLLLLGDDHLFDPARCAHCASVMWLEHRADNLELETSTGRRG